MRHISRELHDEFGQILTAVGAMLSRAGNQVPEGSPLRADLREVAEIAQATLDKVRSLSQALHPVMLDETGLESTLDWYLPVVERQAGIHISYEKVGRGLSRGWQCCYSCVSRGAGSAEQCDPAFRSQRGLGAFAIFCRRGLNWKWKITAADSSSSNPPSRELDWWRCGSERNCWAVSLEFARPVPRRHADSPDRARNGENLGEKLESHAG